MFLISLQSFSVFALTFLIVYIKRLDKRANIDFKMYDVIN